MNEFNLNDGFENYVVVKIFYAPLNDKTVCKEKKKNIYIYIYIHTIQFAILILFAALFQN